MQIIENKHLIKRTYRRDAWNMKRVCKNWNKWFSDPQNHWDFKNPDHFQDDSGI